MKKTCSKCGESYDLETGFYKNKNTPDGHHPACKLCMYPKYKGFTPVKLKKKKKLKLSTISEVYTYINKLGIIPQFGVVLNIYECGHVVSNPDDSHKMAYYSDTQLRNRTCPICTTPTRLLQKYKVCDCGNQQIGIRQQDSRSCYKCCAKKAGLRKSLIYTERKQKKENSHLADPERWDCLLREECLIKYMDCDAIPCLNCAEYQKGVIDTWWRDAG